MKSRKLTNKLNPVFVLEVILADEVFRFNNIFHI